MNIALIAHDNRKELMIQFCIAYCGILSKHTICATGTTGRVVADATGMDVKLFMSRAHGGVQQIGARITYDEIDMVLYFSYPKDEEDEASLTYIRKLCDEHNVPIATNLATAEMLIQGLARGDLDWREIAPPRTKQRPLGGRRKDSAQKREHNQTATIRNEAARVRPSPFGQRTGPQAGSPATKRGAEDSGGAGPETAAVPFPRPRRTRGRPDPLHCATGSQRR